MGPDDEVKGRLVQGGVYYESLCERCNNSTGDWYADDYLAWAWHGARHLAASNGDPFLFRIYHGYPLRIIKQIVTMFLAIDSATFSRAHPYLRDFVSNRELCGLPPIYRIWGYYTDSQKLRYTGITNRCDRGSFDQSYLSEFSYPPFGYVLTIDSPPPDRRLFDMTWFAKYRYSKWTDVAVQLKKLQTYMAFPGDYRSREEIEADYRRNMEASPLDPDKMDPDELAAYSSALERSLSGLARFGGNPDVGIQA